MATTPTPPTTPAPASLQDLLNAVNAEKTVDQSAVTLLNGLTAKIQELANKGPSISSADLQKVIDGIKANTDSLSAAVKANTPHSAAPTTTTTTTAHPPTAPTPPPVAKPS